MEWTQRRKEIIHLASNGFTSEDIGVRLSVATKTVKNILLTMLKQSGAKNTTHLACIAIRDGIVAPHEIRGGNKESAASPVDGKGGE